jgi:hypothetical protein
MANLITRARALYNLNNLSTTAAENTTLDALIAAVSAAIERWCGRSFVSAQYDELYDGCSDADLMLEQFPILSVDRVAYGPMAVLRVQNTSASVQRAKVQVTSTGLTLTRVAAGVNATDTLTFAGNITLAALAAAVNALGNGWSASLTADEFANDASADLRALQGAFAAKDAPAGLKIHLFELTDYDIDSARGLLRRARRWLGGRQHWRVIYTAGYTAVPDDVQEACAQWVAALFWQTKRDPGLAHASAPGSIDREPLGDLPPSVEALLERYWAGTV